MDLFPTKETGLLLPQDVQYTAVTSGSHSKTFSNSSQHRGETRVSALHENRLLNRLPLFLCIDLCKEFHYVRGSERTSGRQRTNP
jgi:hypothetical protein